MSAQGNRALALRAWEVVFNQRNLDALHEVYATDAVWHQPEQDFRGI
jgi:ketosteroid isomerase-like protein